MKNLQWALVIVLIVFAVAQQYRIGVAQSRAEAFRVTADSIAAEAAVREIELEGAWSVRFADETERLGDLLTEGDSAQARLASRLDDANVRIGLLTEVTASATGQIESLSDANLSLLDSINSIGQVFGSWEGPVADEILTGSWGFTLPDAAHILDYSVSIPGELVVSQAGDGRTIVTARATSSLATLELGQVFVDPPPPVEVKTLSWTRALIAALLGAVGWEFVR